MCGILLPQVSYAPQLGFAALMLAQVLGFCDRCLDSVIGHPLGYHMFTATRSQCTWPMHVKDCRLVFLQVVPSALHVSPVTWSMKAPTHPRVSSSLHVFHMPTSSFETHGVQLTHEYELEPSWTKLLDSYSNLKHRLAAVLHVCTVQC